ncbi:MAG: hypothetical protein V3V62_02900 [bacterium]
MRRSLPALLALTLVALVPAPRGEAAPLADSARFEVEGAAVILRQNRARAQKRAIRNAFRNALLRVVRGAMGEEALLQYGDRVESALLRPSHQFIHRFRLLNLKVEAGSRLMRVKLEVHVDRAGVDEVLRSLRLMKETSGAVRVLILVEERILGEGARKEEVLSLRPRRAAATERRLIFRFAQAGYAPLNPRAQRTPAAPGQIASAIRGNTDAARALGGLCRCRLVITARATAERERRDTFVGLATARIIRVKDGSVIAIRSKQVRLRRPRRVGGFEAVLSAAGDLLAASLLAEVRRAFPPPGRAAARRRGAGR